MGGIFGVISKDDCVKDLYYGTDYHSHLGTSRGGMAVFDGIKYNRTIHSIENSYFRTKFEDDLKNFKGNSGIGAISDNESQPIIVRSHLGEYAITTVNKIANINDLIDRALEKNLHFLEMSGSGINPTEIIASLINECDSFESGIENVFNLIKGACTMLILTNDGMIAARDKLGRTPIVLGKKDGSYAVGSETSAFVNLGYEIEKFIGPGEILFITPDGYEQKRQPNDKMQICSFLWVYYGFPASYYEGINVEETRYRLGRAIAKKDNVEVDFASGIPDSGVGSAIGYSNERKIPYKRAHNKYTPTWPRSFMPQKQIDRDLVAKMKLIPIKDIIKDKKIVICDDSIVRGTQLKNNAKALFNYGAKEVHIRPSCPALIHSCEFLNFSISRTSLDLIGRRVIKELEGREDAHLDEYATPGTDRYNKMTEKIGESMECTSLKYQELNDLVEAIGLPKCKLCTHCWDGSSYF